MALEVLMIFKDIYDGKTYEEIGITRESYENRKVLLNEFLPQWDSANDFEESFKLWIKKKNELKNPVQEGSDAQDQCCGSKERNNPGDAKKPSISSMAKDAVSTLYKHASDSFSKTEEDIRRNREATCDKCEFMGKEGIWTGRCMKCGCFMKIKAKMKTAKCPIGRWEK